MIRQTGAILIDAYRELNARKLFWVVLGLTGLVVIVFAMLGINEEGITFAIWTFDAFGVNSDIISPEIFYKGYFVNIGIGVWLTWIATVLALVSTAPIIPDFVSSGSIELSLAKPIGRARLFLTKYFAALLFVVLQVGIFSLGGFLVMGIKGGAWIPTVFLAVPIVTIFFSYLYCICALLGLLTRSSIASLLITLLLWFVLFLLQSVELGLVGFQANHIAQQEVAAQRLEIVEREITTLDEKLAAAQADYEADPNEDTEFEVERYENRLVQRRSWADDFRENIEGSEESERKLQVWRDRAYAVKTVLPKTSETIALLERWMIPLDEMPFGETEEVDDEVLQRNADRGLQMDPETQRRANIITNEEIRERPIWWVIGTSLLFEAVVLGLTTLIFIRRDF